MMTLEQAQEVLRDIHGFLGVHDLDSARSAVEELSAFLGEVEEYIENLEES